MAVPTILGVGVGLVDKGAVDANFTTLVSGGGFSQLNGITARAGGGQALGVPMTACLNRVTVVGSAGDSVVLPSAVGGQAITVINASATSMNVFASNATPTDSINGTVGTSAYAIAAGKMAEFMSFPAVWHALLSA